MTAKEEFIQIFNENIKRDGAQDILIFLENSDFFSAPASTRFHSAHEGGLCEHSIKVYKRLLNLAQKEYGENFEEKLSKESIAISALLHDICKVNLYKTDFRNVKENDVWVKKPYYTINDTIPFGHGEKSVYMLQSFIKLKRDEAMMINWHMGPFDQRIQGGNNFALSDAFYLYPNCLLMFMADISATYFDETSEKFENKK